MNVAFAAGPVINLASGLLLVSLAIFVLSVRPRSQIASRFAAFAAFFGLRFVLVNLNEMLVDAPDLVPAGLGLAGGVACIISVAFLTAFSLAFPSPILRTDRPRLLLFPFLLATAFFLHWNIQLGYSDVQAAVAAGDVSVPVAVGLVSNAVGYTALLASLWGAGLLFALRYRATADPGERRQYALVAAALVIWPAFENSFYGPTRPAALYWVGIAVLVLLASAWLANAGRPGGRTARAVAFVALGAGLAGAASSLLPSSSPLGEGGVGLSRVAGAAILAYAILRHQLLGLDLKVRWGISKTTLAAVFIAVFFVASEAAQEFFGATLGSAYVGILAAGLLVFAIAPLSRFADRVAARAVPVAPGGRGGKRGDRAMRIYERAVRAAVEDGAITASEEEHLAHIAQDLDIAHPDALRVRREVESRGT